MTAECYSLCIQRYAREQGSGVLPYISHIDVPPQRVWFLRRFSLKTGIHFAHFGLELGMVFEGTTGAYERICRLNSK